MWAEPNEDVSLDELEATLADQGIEVLERDEENERLLVGREDEDVELGSGA